jgi:hypothetical protein
MKTRLLLLCALGVLAVNSALGQPQQAWVARYNGGFTNQTHTPLAMKLDNAGNIYIAGSSQNASNLYDYVVLKYAPNGTQLLAARYTSTNGMNFTANGFALDLNGNTYVTGSGGTVKFNANGTTGWTAPYSGNDVAVDTNGNSYVTGFSTNEYATVKLDSNGSNVWLRTYADKPFYMASQKVAVDNAGNVYVAGSDPCYEYEGSEGPSCYYQATLLMYDAAGDPVWTNSWDIYGSFTYTKGLITDNQGNVYIAGLEQSGASYQAVEINASGQTMLSFGTGPNSSNSSVNGMALDTNGNVYLTGGAFTFKVAPTNTYLNLPVWSVSNPNSANGIALDSAANVYVTGFISNGTNNDFATVKFDNNGNQLWVIRYNGPANGNDAAIAIAPDNSIYVTGYSANTNGGSDITIIKYGIAPGVMPQPNGSMLLQFPGIPNQTYGFQGTTDLLNWTNIGSATTDTNGLLQFMDTNAPLFPFRFYRNYLP